MSDSIINALICRGGAGGANAPETELIPPYFGFS